MSEFHIGLSCGHDFNQSEIQETRPDEWSVWCPICETAAAVVTTGDPSFLCPKASHHAWILQRGKMLGWKEIEGLVGNSWGSMSKEEKDEFVEMGHNILRSKMDRTDSPLVRKYARLILEGLVPAQDAEDDDLIDNIQDELDDIWNEMSEAERGYIN
ncbi:MAG: hypothetical protein HN344_05785 [Gammaproteobacteria bacterium]|jgi:hypothetical protein|nr:hypothetical protein [Gammaproteobacteria bacterium]